MRGRQSVPRSTNYDLPAHFLHLPPRPTRNPQARQSRPQTTGSNVGSLRRRLTSPGSSTTSMSPETATGPSPSLSSQIRATTQAPRRKSLTTSPATETPQQAQQAPGGLLPSFGAEAPHIENSPSTTQSSLSDSKGDVSSDNQDQVSMHSRFSTNTERERLSRGIWEWARLGRMGILSRKTSSPPTFLTTKAATLAVNGALQDSRISDMSNSESVDDFSLPSSIATHSELAALQTTVPRSQPEGLGISTEELDGSYFSQTKGSSDDLVASGSVSSVNATPSPSTLRSGSLYPVEEVDSNSTTATATPVHEIAQPLRKAGQRPPAENDNAPSVTSRKEKLAPKSGDSSKRTASAAFKSPQPRSSPQTKPKHERPTTPPEPTPNRKASSGHSPHTSNQSTPKQVPKYKIALASHLLSPARSTAS